MEAKIKKWQQELETITDTFIKDFQSLPPYVWDQEPKENTWSIAENIRHLIVINQSYFPLFKQLLEGDYQKPFTAHFRFLAQMTGKMILKSVDPENSRKQATLSIWLPGKMAPVPPHELMEKFINHQKELSEWISKLAPFLKSRQIIHSPGNKMITYPLETAIEIIITHEKRHLKQARKLRQDLAPQANISLIKKIPNHSFSG